MNTKTKTNKKQAPIQPSILKENQTQSIQFTEINETHSEEAKSRLKKAETLCITQSPKQKPNMCSTSHDLAEPWYFIHS